MGKIMLIDWDFFIASRVSTTCLRFSLKGILPLA